MNQERTRPTMGFLLLQIFEWFDSQLLTRLEKRGWPIQSHAQSLVWPNLDPVNGTRPADLARSLGVSRQAVSQTVNSIVELGLLELIDDPDSGRSKLIVPTEGGRRIQADAVEIYRELEDELGEAIGINSVNDLRHILESFANAISAP